jgi:hypothetical protein
MTRTERLAKLSAQFFAAADDVAEYDEGETSLTCNACGNLTRAFHCSSCLRLVSETLAAQDPEKVAERVAERFMPNADEDQRIILVAGDKRHVQGWGRRVFRAEILSILRSPSQDGGDR